MDQVDLGSESRGFLGHEPLILRQDLGDRGVLLAVIRGLEFISFAVCHFLGEVRWFELGYAECWLGRQDSFQPDISFASS